MTAILVTGYRNTEIGIFSDKDQRIEVIKKAIKRDFIHFLTQGVEWFVFTGNLGFEFWALEVANALKADYPLKIATIFPFETHGSQWNAANQEKLAVFKATDFVKHSFSHYENPQQFKQYNAFLLNNTDGAYVFYDDDNETNLKYLVANMKSHQQYQLSFLTFEQLNEIATEES